MAGTATNRSNVDLPVELSREIIQKAKESSAVMTLAKEIALPGRGTAINVIVGDPEAAWVGETEAKTVANPTLATKVMRAYKLAVIVPFSNEFRRDLSSLYEALVERLPGALGKKFDETVFGKVNAPGSDFDTFANVTMQNLDTDVYQGLVAADTDISTHGGVVNGYAISPQGRGILLGATDDSKRPLFINNTAEGAIPVILGAKTVTAKGAYKAGASASAPSLVGVAGDWSQAMFGTVEGVKIDFSSDATLDLGSGNVINLFQQNMFAVRAEIEVGFRADTSVFNGLTATLS